ncbi:MAG: hypothetical protein P8Y68_20230 [Anaerolineales bacterium]
MLKRKILTQLLKPVFANWHKGSLLEQRARQERMARIEYRPPNLDFKPEEIENIHAEWVIPPNHAGMVLYLHGGAYTVGSINTITRCPHHLSLAAG